MEQPDIPDMLLNRTAEVCRDVHWGFLDDSFINAVELIRVFAAHGLEIRPVDPVLAAQELTGNWEVDG